MGPVGSPRVEVTLVHVSVVVLSISDAVSVTTAVGITVWMAFVIAEEAMAGFSTLRLNATMYFVTSSWSSRRRFPVHGHT